MIGGYEGMTGETTSAIHLYVEDVDAVYQRALEAGAASTQAPAEQPYGDREAGVRDSFGNFWYIATHRGPRYVPEGLATVNPYLHPRGAAALIELDGSGALSKVAIGITGVGSHAFRAAKTEAELKGKKPSPEVLKKACEQASDGVTALEDIHASADYRLDMARVFARRALEAAIARTA